MKLATIAVAGTLCTITYAMQIVMPENPLPSEKTAAQEFKEYLGKTGTELLINGQPPCISIGETKLAVKQGLSKAGMKNEEWIVKTIGNTLFINGGGSRGALYGVYNFLEDRLGVRWWNPFEEYVPENGRMNLQNLEMKGKPFFVFRNIYRSSYPADGGKFAARHRINQDGENVIRPEFGSSEQFGSPYHTHTIARSDGYLPQEKYLPCHPEYFAMIHGKRCGDMWHGQPCFTNPDVYKIFSGKLREYVLNDEKAAAQKGVPPPKIYDISINDNMNFCECQNCRKAIADDNASGVLIQFLNGLADELKAFRPDCCIQTGAYYKTLEPPRHTRARDNIFVRVTDTISVRTEDILSPRNQTFHDVLTKWSKSAAHLIVWFYSITYDDSAGLPYPSEYTYSKNFRFYAENHVSGIFAEHEYPANGDMYDLKVYLEAKLMENPYQDFKALEEDFYQKYYGPAAGQVKAYRDRLRKAAIENKASMAAFSPTSAGFKYIDLQTMLDCQKIMDEAEAQAVGSAVLLQRVRRARWGLDLSLSYTLNFYYAIGAKAAGMNDRRFAEMTDKAGERLLSTFEKASAGLNKNCARSPLDMESIRRTIRAAHSNSGKKLPENFRGKNVLIFPPHSWQIHTVHAKLTDGVNSHSGSCVRIDCSKNPKIFSGAQVAAVHDEVERKPLSGIMINGRSAGNDFQWHKLGKYQIKNPGYVYFTNAWELQFRLDGIAENFKNKPVEIYLEVRFSGKFFDKPGNNMIEAGSIAVVLP